MKSFLLKIIDSCYYLFKKFIPIKTYRYAICGGSNMVLDTMLYFICFHYIFDKQIFDIFTVVLSPHIASLFFVFPITFCFGFLLNRYIVFSDSKLPMWIQFSRYLSVGIAALIISYFSMKILVDIFHFYPTPSRVLTIIITVIFGYIMQHKFSFKVE